MTDGHPSDNPWLDSELLIPDGAVEFHMSVGSGRGAEVYRGRFNGQLVAVKEVPSNSMLDPGCSKRREFETELRIFQQLAKLSHPNLVRFIGYFQPPPLRLVTEFCGGGTLYDLLHTSEQVVLVWPQRLAICSQIASAMEFLHGADPRIIHRDLKSPNVLLARMVYLPDDLIECKVSDFGLALQSSGDDVRDTSPTGTCQWMAPELIGGGHCDETVDVYAYGIMLYEVVCRVPPYDNDFDGPQEVFDFVLQGGRPDLEDQIPPDCPPVLLALMDQCWAQEPKQRPSFKDLVAALPAS